MYNWGNDKREDNESIIQMKLYHKLEVCTRLSLFLPVPKVIINIFLINTNFLQLKYLRDKAWTELDY